MYELVRVGHQELVGGQSSFSLSEAWHTTSVWLIWQRSSGSKQIEQRFKSMRRLQG